MAKRKIAGINTGSMSDISFLLLTFFLLTSSINTDQGIARRLPPPVEEQDKKEVDVNQRNVLKVLVNFNDALLVNDEFLQIDFLKDKAKEFLENPYDDPKLPEKKLEAIENLGEYRVSKGV